ncbi:MAG TPA: preprotein translocase subunit SecG [Mobilitalea sp.]|nr:preprotein translocase subunit SecG [Mobilitalea sp.]
MDVLKTLVQIIYIGICVVLVVIVLKQEGKGGLSGALTGASETYWSKNKGRSREGWLERTTKILAGSFIILSVVLNLNW